MKIYIAGRIAGDQNYKSKFAEVEEYYKKQGHVVLNPATLPSGLSPADYMRINFAQIDVADAVSFLPDTINSEGALLEKNYCDYTGKPCKYFELDFNNEATT